MFFPVRGCWSCGFTGWRLRATDRDCRLADDGDCGAGVIETEAYPVLRPDHIAPALSDFLAQFVVDGEGLAHAVSGLQQFAKFGVMLCQQSLTFVQHSQGVLQSCFGPNGADDHRSPLAVEFPDGEGCGCCCCCTGEGACETGAADAGWLRACP